MIFMEILIFLLALLVAKYFWENRRFFYLAYKIPTSTFDYSLKGIYGVLTANNRTILRMLRDSFVDNKVCTKTWVGTFMFVGVIKPEDIKTILNSKHCLDKPMIIKFSNILKGSLFGDLQYWHSHRKILNPFFGVQRLRNIIPIFNEKTKILMENVRKMEGKGEFNVLYSMTAFTLETIIKVMEYDVDIQNQKSEIRDSFITNLEKFLALVSLRAFKLWLYPDIIYKYSKMYRKQLEAESKTAIVFTDSIIKNARNRMKIEENENENSKTFIRALIDPKNKLSDLEIIDEVKSVVLAAQDTSAIASSSTLLLLAMHKNVQQKVIEELHGTFGKTHDAPYLDYEKLNELKYLELVINETMRLLPVVPYVFRLNSMEIELSEGYILPAETYIIIPIFEVHRLKKIWGDDAEKFRPERFEKENFMKIPQYSFIPFVKGPRMCVGWRYAMLLMKIQLTNFLLRYEVDTHLKLEDLDFQLNITMNICQGYMISIKKRRIE